MKTLLLGWIVFLNFSHSSVALAEVHSNTCSLKCENSYRTANGWRKFQAALYTIPRLGMSGFSGGKKECVVMNADGSTYAKDEVNYIEESWQGVSAYSHSRYSLGNINSRAERRALRRKQNGRLSRDERNSLQMEKLDQKMKAELDRCNQGI